MGTYTIKSFTQILNDMIAYVLANSPQITDVSPGSIIRSFCEASALSLEELYVAAYLGFQRALSTIAPDKFNFARKTGTYSQGNVEFYASSSPSQNITIPIGTRVQTSSGLVYATTSVGTIPSGASSPYGSGLVPVQASAVGSSYNVSGTTPLSMLDDVNGVVSVSWYSSIGPTGGTDQESDFQYQSRFQAYIEGLAGSNVAGLIAGALSVSGVTSASVLEEFPPVSNVNAYLYIDNGSTVGAPASLVTQVQQVINGQYAASNPGTNAGYRAAGVNVVVQAASVVAITVDVTVVPTSANIPTNTLTSDTQTAVTGYVNYLTTNSNVEFYAVSSAIMQVYGVQNITVLTINGGSSDITIGAGQVGRISAVNVTVS